MRVLFVSLRSDDLGLPSRLLPIAAELRTRGHEIAFASPDPAPAKLIASAGFPNLECPPMYSSGFPTVFAEATPVVRDYDHFLALLGWCDHEFTAQEIENCTSVLRSWSPDVVVDSFDAGWCTAARILNIPFVEVLQADLHPDGPGFTWWMPPSPSPTPVDAFNEVLARASLPKVDRASRLLLGTATVVVGGPATDPVPDPELRHVGALLWGDPAAELPAAIPPPGRRPLIFLYGGKPRYAPGMTIWCDSAIVLDASIQALADLDVDVVVGAGNQELPDSLPANFIPLDYAPGQALARRADVMVHHGGHGSTLTALTAGTQALIIPTYSERESNGRRAAALGAALCLVPEMADGDAQVEPKLALVGEMGGTDRQLEPRLVADAIRALLEDPRYANAARVASQDLARLPGAAGAAGVIEALDGLVLDRVGGGVPPVGSAG